MILALPVIVGVPLGLLFGGSLAQLAGLRLRCVELFYLAVGAQIVAFPFPFLPWHTSDAAGTALWLASYGLLLCAAILNRSVTGVPVVAAGMVANVAAVLANGGHMPALPGALKSAGLPVHRHFNSAPDASPHLSWLVDRWAVPPSLHLGNVYSVGDIMIAVGALVVVCAAMGAKRPLRRWAHRVEAAR